jgi:hypothetical protein
MASPGRPCRPGILGALAAAAFAGAVPPKSLIGKS